MSFSIGGSKSNEKTSSTENFNKTSQGTAPDWIQNALKGITSKVTSLSAEDPRSFIPGADNLHTQAADSASRLTGSPWNFDSAAKATRDVMQAGAPTTSGVRASGFLKDYLDPFLSDVVDSTRADMEHQAGLVRAQQALDMNRSGAFGGSRSALTEAATEEGLSRALGSILSGLRSDGFKTALGAADADASRAQSAGNLNAQLAADQLNRKLSGAGQLTDISTAMDANSRANIAAQAGIGDIMRGIAGEEAQAPLTLASWAGSNLPALLQGLFGNTEAGSGSATGKSSGTKFGFSATGGKSG